MARSTRSLRALVVLAVVAVLAGCGGGKDEPASSGNDGPPASGPRRGGSVRYGLEAESGGGFCLQEAQLAVSGMLVARSVYDTLTVPTAAGEYVPYLAEAVEPNEDFTEWTITVRDGITFHDGTPLTADVVKNNLDAYRGAEGDHARSPLLFLFVFSDIDAVEVTGDREVTVTTKVPWVSFPAFLWSSGRLGITGQAQLDDTEDCGRHLVGTGPFMLESPDDWVEGRAMRLTRNPGYWQVAPDGEPYPYLDELVFEPITEPEQRANALEVGDVQLAHFNAAADVVALRDMVEAGTVASYETTTNAEVTFLQMNLSRPPFDDVRVRRAIALAIDREDYGETVNQGALEPANGVFAPGSPYHLDDTGYPAEPDLDEARRLLAEHEAEHGPIRPLGYLAPANVAAQQQATYIQQELAEVGLEVEVEAGEQESTIDRLLAGEYDMQLFRGYPGGDPDLLSIWFTSGSPVNFARIADPEVDRILAEGRSEPDPEARVALYQALNRRMGEEALYGFLSFTTWVVGSSPSVHGYDPATAPPVPGGGAPDEGLATGHPTHGLWTDDA
jgi:peptide/nickel transport system substrate-binding protein